MPRAQLAPADCKIIGLSEPRVRKTLAAGQAGDVLKIRAFVDPVHLGFGAQAGPKDTHSFQTFTHEGRSLTAAPQIHPATRPDPLPPFED